MWGKKSWEQEYAEMTVEELERRYRETFFYTDRIDETVYLELERLGEALEKKRQVELSPTEEESWERFALVHAEALSQWGGSGARGKAAPKAVGFRSILRIALIAAVVLAFLAGAALAADSLGLWVWGSRWNAGEGRFALKHEDAAAGSPIRAALAELEITERVYPAYLPEGFVITEYHINEVPRLMVEQYARGRDRLSITVTTARSVRSGVYQSGGAALREYRNGASTCFLLENEGTVTAIRYTERFATFISGNLTPEEMMKILDSIDPAGEGGDPV